MNTNLNIQISTDGHRLEACNYIRQVKITSPMWNAINDLFHRAVVEVTFGTKVLGTGDTNTAALLHKQLFEVAIHHSSMRAKLKFLQAEREYAVSHVSLKEICGEQDSSFVSWILMLTLEPPPSVHQ